jgi:hypothetical protein
MPFVVMLPLTDRSGRIVMIPLPVADVVTGGTSWLPCSTTRCPSPVGVVAHPAKSSATQTTDSNDHGCSLISVTFMLSSISSIVGWHEIRARIEAARDAPRRDPDRAGKG